MGSWKNINWTKWIAIGLPAIGVVLYVIVEREPLVLQRRFARKGP